MCAGACSRNNAYAVALRKDAPFTEPTVCQYVGRAIYLRLILDGSGRLRLNGELRVRLLHCLTVSCLAY
jgi:hypothetical protein